MVDHIDIRETGRKRNDDLAKRVVELAGAQNLSIGSCESFTAGLFCAVLGSVPGASKVLCGGLITYQTVCKERLHIVSKELVDTYGVVSSQCALAMALQAKNLLGTDICVSFTGNAGPDAMENKPAGLVYCALALDDQVDVFEFRFDLERNLLRRQAVNEMLQILVQRLERRRYGKENSQNERSRTSQG